MSARCLDCHTTIATEQADPTALHGAIPAGQTCQTCHGEHGGADASLTDTALEGL
ncbi:MAG: hypothetical protein HGA45_24830, partial [Chloroflexales bacterium]|nr:hypothetical protein [Chloroflexales bacterium]